MSQPGTLIHTVLDKTLQFFQESKNRERIQTHCIDPLMRHVLDRLFPYIILTCILFTLILLMSFASIWLLMIQLRATPGTILSTALELSSTNLSPV
jgi:hypothetical protein